MPWYGFLAEEDDHLIEDKRNSKAYKADIRRNDKKHIPPLSLLLLWHKIVAMHYFVCDWPRQVDRNLSFGDF